ncbi:MAG: hypothetical protein ACK47D_06315, partial [Pseudanabaena sp.]
VLIPASSFWLFSNYFTLPLRAECGFEHGELIRWLQQNQWSWAIRAKSDLLVTLPTGYDQAHRTTNTSPRASLSSS